MTNLLGECLHLLHYNHSPRLTIIGRNRCLIHFSGYCIQTFGNFRHGFHYGFRFSTDVIHLMALPCRIIAALACSIYIFQRPQQTLFAGLIHLCQHRI